MSRIVWKEGSVISIETRRNVFNLAQMTRSPYLIFFNLFREDDDWRDINLNESPVLFCKAVTRHFLQNSNITKRKDIKPNNNYKLPTEWLHSDAQGQIIKIWEGSDYERECLLLGTRFSLVEKDIEGHPGGPRKHHSGVFDALLVGEVPKDDIATIDSHETTGLSVFPETNERLYLCYKFGKNVDPHKELIVGRELPIEYETYFKITGKLSEKDKSDLLQLYIA